MQLFYQILSPLSTYFHKKTANPHKRTSRLCFLLAASSRLLSNLLLCMDNSRNLLGAKYRPYSPISAASTPRACPSVIHSHSAFCLQLDKSTKEEYEVAVLIFQIRYLETMTKGCSHIGDYPTDALKGKSE